MLVFDTKNSRSDDIYSDVLTWQFRIFELSWRNCRRGWLRSYQDWAKLQSKDKRNPKSRVEEKFMGISNVLIQKYMFVFIWNRLNRFRHH